MDAKDRASDDAESAKGTGSELGEIVAGDILDDFAAAGGERAVRKSDGDTDDEVAKGAETETKCAAVISREDAADGGFFGPKRIERETLAVLGESLLQSLNEAAGFDGDGEIGPNVFEDFVEARGREDEIGARGRIAPSEFAAAAARDDGEFGFIGKTKNGGELVFVGGFEKELRLDARDGVSGSGGADSVGAKKDDEFFLEDGRRSGRCELGGGIHGAHCGCDREKRPLQKAAATKTGEHQKRSARPAVSTGWAMYSPGFSPQRRGVGKILVGFESCKGSKAQRTRCMVSRSGSANILGIIFFLS